MDKQREQIPTKENTWKENKHIERCSTWLVITKTPIKTAVRYHCIPIRMSKIKKEEVEVKKKEEKKVNWQYQVLTRKQSN